MKTKILVATFVALSAIGTAAQADEATDATATGFAAGAVTGAVVGGPFGAVVGGMVGTTAGAAIDENDRTREEIIIRERQTDPDTVVIDE